MEFDLSNNDDWPPDNTKAKLINQFYIRLLLLIQSHKQYTITKLHNNNKLYLIFKPFMVYRNAIFHSFTFIAHPR